MSPRRHLDDLFSAAYEDDLSPIDDARFHSHIQSCEPCAAAYAEFRATIEALHELPRASMPRVVHLPSTAPIAERAPRTRPTFGWFNLGALGRFPATLAAGAVAAVLVIVALTHGIGNTSTNTPGLQSGALAPAAGPGSNASDAACAQQIVGITAAPVPASFLQADQVADPRQPALHLVLATPSIDVTAGREVLLYAQLSVPVATISNPGSPVAPERARAARPCVSVTVGTSGQAYRPAAAAGVPGVLATPGALNGGPAPAPGNAFPTGQTDPLLAFNVPAGLAPGTELRVVATVPAGYGGPGSPALTATLTLITH